MEKTFKTLQDQVAILRSRGIHISDEPSAISVLEHINYYTLINGYKDPFLLSTAPEDQYRPGTRFEEIWALYRFDRRLREQLLVELLRIEREIQTNITYTFSSFHGCDHRTYLRPECFNIAGGKNAELVDRLIHKMFSTISYFAEKHKAISHYLSEYHYVPLWVLATVLTFGATNQFFSRMHFREKQIVASRYHLTPKQLESVLHILCAFRNKCAHGERIYSYGLDTVSSNYIPIFPEHRLLAIPANRKGPKFGREDVLALLIVMKYFMTPNRYTALLAHISLYLSQLSQELTSIRIERIRLIMGLPDNWRYLRNTPAHFRQSSQTGDGL